MSYREMPILIIKHLMIRPHTSVEIQRSTGLCENSVLGWLRAFEDQGLAYRVEGDPNNKRGRVAGLWHWNHSGPFAHL